MTPLPPYEHLELRPEDRMTMSVPAKTAVRTALWILATAVRYPGRSMTIEMGSSSTSYVEADYEPSRRPRPSRAVIGWLLVSLAVVLLVGVSVALFLRGFGA